MGFSSILYSGKDEDAVVCYFCLDAGPDESGLPLIRNCLCCGTDAGFVNLSCLAKYAAFKSKQTCEMNKFRDPWRFCPNCLQTYQNEFAVNIAAEFVSFVQQNYPQDTQRQVEALDLKLYPLLYQVRAFEPFKLQMSSYP